MTLVVAGASGDSGKTLVSLGLAATWRQAGVDVRAFKKGPDYIDAAWLTRAARRPARNLDVWMMGDDMVRRSYAKQVAGGGVAVVEGNRGLFDGCDGTSTVQLAKLIEAPIVLVLDITKMTRTAAAIVAGCRALDPDVPLAGVVLNRVGGPRHLEEARTAIEQETAIPVLGALPRLAQSAQLPYRHLGLVPPEEHGRMDEVVERLAAVVQEYLAIDRLRELASVAPPAALAEETSPAAAQAIGRVKIGWFHDAAFTFYYPENLEALEASGADLVPISALEDECLPDVDLLYIGGGFPETHAPVLADNVSMLRSVREACRSGLPIYAECGGLIYLSRSVRFQGRRYELSGALDVDVEVMVRPQGHGYAEAVVDAANPFFEQGTVFRGHEFHYARIVPGGEDPDLALGVRRGTGSRSGRDGLVAHNVLASWIHLHALGAAEWAPALVERARRRAAERSTTRGGRERRAPAQARAKGRRRDEVGSGPSGG